MATEVIMPKVDMDMASGKVMTWHVDEGGRVEKGAPLFDIETDKAAMEVEAETAGYLHHRVAEGTEIAIGRPVAWIYAEGEDVAEAPADTAPPPPKAVESAPPPRAQPDSPDTATPGTRATPRARSLARDSGIDIATIAGTGPRGRVQGADVAARLDAPVPAQAAPETGPLAVSRSKAGTGTPIVLIHGFASDSISWAPMEAALKHRPLIRIDLPGHGKSPRLRVADFAALAAQIRHALDDLDLDRFDLVGHSLGGALALAFADTRHRRVNRLTLIASAGLGPDINGAALTGLCAATRAASLGPWLRTLVASDEIITDSYIRLAMAARADARLRAAQTALADTLFPDGVQAFDLRAALHRTQIPTRLIWGKRDAIIPWRHALHAPGRVALHLFEDLGHIPQIENPEMIGNLISAAP